LKCGIIIKSGHNLRCRSVLGSYSAKASAFSPFYFMGQTITTLIFSILFYLLHHPKFGVWKIFWLCLYVLCIINVFIMYFIMHHILS